MMISCGGAGAAGSFSMITYSSLKQNKIFDFEALNLEYKINNLSRWWWNTTSRECDGDWWNSSAACGWLDDEGLVAAPL